MRCTVHQKRIHRTFGAAMSAASSCSLKWNKPLRAYYDDECCCYHVTSQMRLEVAA